MAYLGGHIWPWPPLTTGRGRVELKQWYMDMRIKDMENQQESVPTMIILIIIWFGDIVTVLHLTKYYTNSKVRAMSA